MAAGSPVVGYLGYDHIAALEPTVPLPDESAGLPESLFVIADTLVRFDHARASAEVLAGDRDAVADLLARPVEAPGSTGGARGETTRSPREAYEAWVVEAKRLIAEGDAFDRPLPAGRAAHVGDAGRALPGATPREPVAVPLPPGAGAGAGALGSSPETLVKLEGRRRA